MDRIGSLAGMDIQTKEQIELRRLPNMEIMSIIMPGVHDTMKTGGRTNISLKSAMGVYFIGNAIYVKCQL